MFPVGGLLFFSFLGELHVTPPRADMYKISSYYTTEYNNNMGYDGGYLWIVGCVVLWWGAGGWGVGGYKHRT